MSRVLVTGASGLVGRAAVPALADRGFEVHAVTTSRQPVGDDRLVWHRADLLDPRQTTEIVRAARPTHLLHLAWHTQPADIYVSPMNVRWVDAGIHLLQEFARHGGRRAAIAGSCAEYDWSVPLSSEETTPKEPATLYGASKYALWLLASRMTELQDVDLAWGRLFSVFGPGEHAGRLVPFVARALLTDQPASCTLGTQIRDFLYSGDAAAAFVALLESDVNGPVTIASGTGIPVRDLISEVGVVTGRPDLIRFGEVAMRANEPAELVADTRRLNDEVGWSPAVGLHEGIAHTVRWWSDQLSAAEASEASRPAGSRAG
jgi:nucleoside-diphosphate-sugar epimerase